jgi:hypothetical protein
MSMQVGIDYRHLLSKIINNLLLKFCLPLLNIVKQNTDTIHSVGEHNA